MTNPDAVDATAPSSETKDRRRMGELTVHEQTVFDMLNDVSKSGYAFRVVVVGRQGGAILESTVNCLGPIARITQSPSKGML
jgi:hypothetical protein